MLRTRIQGGNPPDVAIIPGIGTLRSLARDGSLIPLYDLGIDRNEIEDNYAPGLLDIGLVDGNIYGAHGEGQLEGGDLVRPDPLRDDGRRAGRDVGGPRHAEQ